MDSRNEVDILKAQVRHLIEDNMELHSRLELDGGEYDPTKPIRKLTLQEKLEINMGNELKKYRIPTSEIKKIYYTIIKSGDKEPENVDVSFNSQRYLTAFYLVDKEKEEEEIEKGENVGIDLSKIPDDMPEVQHLYDMIEVVNRLTDISSKVGKVSHDSIPINQGRERQD